MNKKNNIVFYASIALTLAIVFWGFLSPVSFETAGNASFKFLSTNFNYLQWIFTKKVILFFYYFILNRY